jgi:hypothetical protein
MILIFVHNKLRLATGGWQLERRTETGKWTPENGHRITKSEERRTENGKGENGESENMNKFLNFRNQVSFILNSIFSNLQIE